MQGIRRSEITELEAMLLVRNLQGYRKKLQKLCASIMPEMDWPEDLIGTERRLGKKIQRYEDEFRRLSAYEHLLLIISRNMYVSFVLAFFDDRFMSALVLDTAPQNNPE